MDKNVIVFYSWQSNLPKHTNLNAIRQCLREASTQIEANLEDVRISLEEATRNIPGSPNIPQTIFNKIEQSDIFICDLSTINFETETEKKVQNPNVLIELGYAISILGWSRIILLANTYYTNFPQDLPFDIDRHRATPFQIENKEDKSGKNKLTNVLTDSIRMIIESSPLKPHELKERTPEEIRKERDIQNLTLALNCINIHTFDMLIDFLPQNIPAKILFYYEFFQSVVNSKSFYIYNEETRIKLDNFRNSLITILSFSHHYMPTSNGNFYSYNLPLDIFPSEIAEKDFYFLLEYKETFNDSLKDFLNYIRENFIEIDLEVTSKNALESYKRTHE